MYFPCQWIDLGTNEFSGIVPRYILHYYNTDVNNCFIFFGFEYIMQLAYVLWQFVTTDLSIESFQYKYTMFVMSFMQVIFMYAHRVGHRITLL